MSFIGYLENPPPTATTTSTSFDGHPRKEKYIKSPATPRRQACRKTAKAFSW